MNDKKAQAFVIFARQVAKEETIWADWHNRVFGVGGKFVELFPTKKDRVQFVNSSYYTQIERLSKALRKGMSIQQYTIPTD